MKGTVVSTWIKTCRRLYGESVVDEAMESNGWNKDKFFTPVETVEDEKIKSVIRSIANQKGMDIGKLWREIGRDNLQTFYKDYPALFEHDNLYSFLRSLFDIHVVMTKKFSGAKPPLVGIEAISSREVYFTYRSKRGMFDYFMGLLTGSCEHFNEKVDIKQVEKNSEYLKLKLTFSKDIYYKKKYILNNMLSFGFIKSFSGKIALATFIPIIILSIILAGPVKGIIISAFSSIISFIVSSLLIRPKEDILEELKRINSNKYFHDGKICTNDFFEQIYDELKVYGKVVRSDFTGFKGITDEMNSFVSTINEISENMNYTSGEISGVVEQVATGAVNQAENTEEAVSRLNGNIEALKGIVQNENSNKKELEKAMDKINNSFSNVDNASKNIETTLESFMKVKEKGANLQGKAQDITSIVSIVSDIAEQTNLLALNASIEAARAGDQGRGFAVVAESIRKLAEQSKEAVRDINSNLAKFVDDIGMLVGNIDSQYKVLEDETNSLSVVRDISYEATVSIQSVSESMIQTISELNKEADSIASIYDTIESLSAIAEENSASSEEVSANVSKYTEEIRRLITNIADFKKVTNQFKKDLEKYKI
ncbi:heme NO-binding domain-containing protein [Clostridium frigidicarnis]|uniref:Methyl-accepting chemotaxis protein n=1 Tax=Clostridium frigidicarnis TaxID=84698 RepID=A0A1I0YQH7_9CLOT|nr:heme NO-binding domain-containing protein [Clostridium frigidicarnis]SFB15462.1 Methyl-accepting chemotaxis protein [Clostridium frigidicarnis]